MAQTVTQGQIIDGQVVNFNPNTGKPLKKGETVTVLPLNKETLKPGAMQGSKPVSAPSQTTTSKPPVITSKKADEAVNNATADIESMSLTQTKPKTLDDFDTELYETMDEAQENYKNFQEQVESIQEGAIKYSPDEQAQLNAISSAVANATKAQARANRQSERGTRLISNIRGVGEFAPVRGMSMMQQTIQSGLDQLRTIEVEGAAKLGEAKQAIRSNRFSEIVKAYDETKDILKQRQDILGKLRDNAFEMEKFEYQKLNDAREFALKEREFGLKAQQAGLEMEKLRRELEKGTVTPDGARGLVDTVVGVDEILANTGGLKAAIGQTAIQRRGFGRKGQKQIVIGSIENLTAGLTLEGLISAKDSGATFGALSEGEMRLLANSATKLNQWAKTDKNGNVKGWAAPESAVIKELNNIKNMAKVDYERKTGQPYPSAEEDPLEVNTISVTENNQLGI